MSANHNVPLPMASAAAAASRAERRHHVLTSAIPSSAGDGMSCAAGRAAAGGTRGDESGSIVADDSARLAGRFRRARPAPASFAAGLGRLSLAAVPGATAAEVAHAALQLPERVRRLGGLRQLLVGHAELRF